MKLIKNECNYADCALIIQSNLFKTCHHCKTVYCSSSCRQLDWFNHKNECFIGRLNSDCKRILSKVNRNFVLRNELSKVARTAYLGTLQRGFVWLDFSSDDDAQEFLTKSFNQKQKSNFLSFFGDNLLPKYVCFDPVKNQSSTNNVAMNLFANHYIFDETKQENGYESFIKMCIDYDPLNEFILIVSVRLDLNDRNQNYVLRFIKVKFIADLSKDQTSDTLILTGLKAENSFKSDEATSEDRRIFLANLLIEFETRGIELRSKYPKIYRDLCLYVEDNKHFTPVCLFPRDLNKNNLFMCLIMPNSEQCNYSWLYDYENEKINTKKNLYNYLYIL